ncbi:hypothetical protein PCANC_05055 [Puccinia coronata f. sp. avenae]|uniref:Uncharacterized protein n=1 Tax=Puccinia coronata f. sp. avenae TaxID=200324 RepID=A0A2N5T764_9BASI|nr:hypothetical protein PCANC_05055 [Puccinia coronata f. sp. avenae]
MDYRVAYFVIQVAVEVGKPIADSRVRSRWPWSLQAPGVRGTRSPLDDRRATHDRPKPGVAPYRPSEDKLSSADRYTLYRPAEDDFSWAGRCTLYWPAEEVSSSAGRCRVYRSAKEESPSAGRYRVHLPAEEYSSLADWYNTVPACRGGILLGGPIQDCTGLPGILLGGPIQDCTGLAGILLGGPVGSDPPGRQIEVSRGSHIQLP